MTATNKANSLYAFLDGTPETLKVTQQDGHIKGRLSHTNDKIETLLQVMEKCLPVRTQEWEYVETEITSRH